jgi:hypothetical protein
MLASHVDAPANPRRHPRGAVGLAELFGTRLIVDVEHDRIK